MVAATLVTVSEDAELRLLSYLEDEALEARCAEYMAGGKIDQFLETVVPSPKILIPSALYILASLMLKSKTPKAHLERLVQTISSTASVDQVSLLVVLWHSLPDFKGFLLLQMMKTSLSHPTVVDLLSGSTPKLLSLLQDVDAAERGTIYQWLVQNLNDPDSQQVFRSQYLLSNNNNSSKKDPQITRDFMIQALQNPVRATLPDLETTDGPLNELYSTMQTGTLQDYENLTQKHPNLLHDLGLDATKCDYAMKLFTLCHLAEAQLELPYATIEASLKIDNPEYWVIQAIDQGLLQAKMDQQRHMVLVESCRSRNFSNWTSLKEQLASWKTTVAEIRAVLNSQ